AGLPRGSSLGRTGRGPLVAPGALCRRLCSGCSRPPLEPGFPEHPRGGVLDQPWSLASPHARAYLGYLLYFRPARPTAARLRTDPPLGHCGLDSAGLAVRLLAEQSRRTGLRPRLLASEPARGARRGHGPPGRPARFRPELVRPDVAAFVASHTVHVLAGPGGGAAFAPRPVLRGLLCRLLRGLSDHVVLLPGRPTATRSPRPFSALAAADADPFAEHGSSHAAPAASVAPAVGLAPHHDSRPGRLDRQPVYLGPRTSPLARGDGSAVVGNGGLLLPDRRAGVRQRPGER